MKLFILSFILSFYLSAMTAEEALCEVTIKGSLSAARLLGIKGIPLPDNGINKDLCQKMWGIGHKKFLALQVHLTPAEEPKPRKTPEEIALLKQQRKKLKEEFEEKQRQIKELQRQRYATQKQIEDEQFDDTATRELFLKQYKQQQQRLLAIKAAKAREEEEKKTQRIKVVNLNQLFDLQQEELTDRKKIEAQHNSSKLLKATYEEMLIILSIFENAELLYEFAVEEKKNTIRRIAAQHAAFRTCYQELIGTWNFRFFFFKLARLETADGDPFHDLRIFASDFCNQNNIRTIKTAKTGTSYAFFMGAPHPLFTALDQFVMFPLRGIDLSKCCVSPLSVARFITSPSYGLTGAELSPCEEFIDICETAEAYALVSDPAIVSMSSIAYKIPFYKLLKGLRHGGIDRLIDLLEKEQEIAYIDALAILIFKNRHNTGETERLTQRYSSIQKTFSERVWNSCRAPNFIMMLLEGLNTPDPLDFQDVVVSIPPTDIWTWYVNAKKLFDSKFPESSARSAFEINQSEFYIFVWNMVVNTHLYHGQPIYKEWTEPLKQVLDPIYAYFKRLESVCKNLGTTNEERAKRYVLDYQEQYDQIFR